MTDSFTNEYIKAHISQHLERLDVDTSNYTKEDNHIRSSMPVQSFPKRLEVCLRHGLYLYDFSMDIVENSDTPYINFHVCGDLENMTAFRQEVGIIDPTNEEIEQAILEAKNDPDLAKFYQ